MTSTASRSNRPCSAQRMQGLAVYRNLLRREPMPFTTPSAPAAIKSKHLDLLLESIPGPPADSAMNAGIA